MSTRVAAGFLKFGNKRYEIYEGVNTIGRNTQAVVNIKNTKISHYHAVITVIHKSSRYISDLKSSNDTFLDGEKLTPLKLYKLQNGASIKFADLSCTYIEEASVDHDYDDSSHMSQDLGSSIYIHDTQKITSESTQNVFNVHEAPTQFIVPRPSNGINIHEMPTQIFEENEAVVEETADVSFNEVSSNIHEMQTQIINVENHPQEENDNSSDSVDLISMQKASESQSLGAGAKIEAPSSEETIISSQIFPVGLAQNTLTDSDLQSSSTPSCSQIRPVRMSLKPNKIFNSDSEDESTNSPDGSDKFSQEICKHNNRLNSQSENENNSFSSAAGSSRSNQEKRRSKYVISDDDETDIEDDLNTKNSEKLVNETLESVSCEKNVSQLNDSEVIPATQDPGFEQTDDFLRIPDTEIEGFDSFRQEISNMSTQKLDESGLDAVKDKEDATKDTLVHKNEELPDTESLPLQESKNEDLPDTESLLLEGRLQRTESQMEETKTSDRAEEQKADSDSKKEEIAESVEKQLKLNENDSNYVSGKSSPPSTSDSNRNTPDLDLEIAENQPELNGIDPNSVSAKSPQKSTSDSNRNTSDLGEESVENQPELNAIDANFVSAKSPQPSTSDSNRNTSDLGEESAENQPDLNVSAKIPQPSTSRIIEEEDCDDLYLQSTQKLNNEDNVFKIPDSSLIKTPSKKTIRDDDADEDFYAQATQQLPEKNSEDKSNDDDDDIILPPTQSLEFLHLGMDPKEKHCNEVEDQLHVLFASQSNAFNATQQLVDTLEDSDDDVVNDSLADGLNNALIPRKSNSDPDIVCTQALIEDLEDNKKNSHSQDSVLRGRELKTYSRKSKNCTLVPEDKITEKGNQPPVCNEIRDPSPITGKDLKPGEVKIETPRTRGKPKREGIGDTQKKKELKPRSKDVAAESSDKSSEEITLKTKRNQRKSKRSNTASEQSNEESTSKTESVTKETILEVIGSKTTRRTLRNQSPAEAPKIGSKTEEATTELIDPKPKRRTLRDQSNTDEASASCSSKSKTKKVIDSKPNRRTLIKESSELISKDLIESKDEDINGSHEEDAAKSRNPRGVKRKTGREKSVENKKPAVETSVRRGARRKVEKDESKASNSDSENSTGEARDKPSTSKKYSFKSSSKISIIDDDDVDDFEPAKEISKAGRNSRKTKLSSIPESNKITKATASTSAIISVSSASSIEEPLNKRPRRLSANSRRLKAEEDKKGKPSTSESESSETDNKRSRPSKTTSVPQSPERSKRKLKPKVVFTMLDDSNLESIIRQLGGSVVDTVDASTVLVTGSVKRSLKLLCAVGQAKPICSPDWIAASRKASMFLDPWDFLLVDKEAEKKWNFSLKESLRRSSSRKLFENFTFQVIVNNAADVLKGAIEACGGKCVVRNLPKSGPDNLYVVSTVESKSKYEKLIKQNPKIKVIEPEAVFDATLRQEIQFKKHLIM